MTDYLVVLVWYVWISFFKMKSMISLFLFEYLPDQQVVRSHVMYAEHYFSQLLIHMWLQADCFFDLPQMTNIFISWQFFDQMNLKLSNAQGSK